MPKPVFFGEITRVCKSTPGYPTISDHVLEVERIAKDNEDE